LLKRIEVKNQIIKNRTCIILLNNERAKVQVY